MGYPGWQNASALDRTDKRSDVPWVRRRIRKRRTDTGTRSSVMGTERLDIQCLKERGRYCHRIYLLGRRDSGATQIEIKENSAAAEQFGIVLEIPIVRWRNAQLRHVKPPELAVNDDRRIGIRVGKRTQYHGIECGKCRSRSAESKREDKNTRGKSDVLQRVRYRCDRRRGTPPQGAALPHNAIEPRHAS